MTPTRQHIITYARTFLGVKWKHQGRDPRFGLDCCGLLRVVAAEFHLTDFDLQAYERQPDGKTLDEIMDRELVRIKPGQAGYGDIVSLADRKWSCHVGLLADAAKPFSLIHAYAGARKVTENRLDEQVHKVLAYYRFPNLPEDF